MPPDPAELTLAHSPDPDDVFMWWPVTGMIDPRDHARVVRPPALDTGRFRFRAIPADIDVLNRRAIATGDLDVTALSINTYAHVKDRYALTAFGASMGYGYGPKVVRRHADAAHPLPEGGGRGKGCSGHSTVGAAVSQAEAPGSPPPNPLPRGGGVEGMASLTAPDSLIAVPGTRTTAFLLLSMMLGKGAFRHVEMPFDRILDAVAAGRNGVTAGLLIHQSQLTFAELGLELLADVGEFWLARTGLPLPLGGNALRRDLDARHGPGSTAEVARLLDASIRHALAHRDESARYAMGFAPEITRDQAERYIDMYVSDLTVDAGETGRAAIQRLLDEGHRLGLCPDPGPVHLVRAEV